ncbi:orotate phosphoribosyltransferase [Alkalicoccus daliensis]|uniref:Orotate phosphoribosyltransferase n=1 Tax=Alkalicoccus daliensis TaxID=745820 RepID=A0A1G9ZXI8_9BACI|nr:orotate phosphoribosyltransferase [Alkalicoccus daliensis]SDN25835.1 orotate phosphoribosyltransferase [Alkalicoccus daliensis]
MDTAVKAAETLIGIEAVTLAPENPFTWSSGLKSPIYCDNRLLLSHPEERRFIYKAMADKIKNSGADVIAGTATAGIPHAAWIAEELNLPMIYVRSSNKGHGKQNKIEGKLKEGSAVVIIEDLISTGGSAFQAAEAVEAAGANVIAVHAIFTYELAAAEKAIASKSYPVTALTTFGTLAEAASDKGYITKESLESLRAWQQDPESWSKEAAHQK